MLKHKARWLLAGLLGLALLSACELGGDKEWEKYNSAGMQAYEQGDYSDAEGLWRTTLEITKEFGPEDQRLATSLNNLAALYRAQGHYAKAEPLHKRSLAIREKALGSEHPEVATSLNNLALLYQSR